MTKFDELLKNEKVKWKKLREVCKIYTGRLNVKEKTANGTYPFFTTSKEISYIDTYAFEGESLLVTGNANIGDVKYFHGKFNAYQRIYVLQKFKYVNALFLMHYMKMEFKKYLFRKKKQAVISYIVLQDIEDFIIPIPSFTTQEKIVKILGKFTSYIHELQAEYKARTKQYEYYKNLLLSEEYLYKVSEKMATDSVDRKLYKCKRELLKQCVLDVEKIKWNDVSTTSFKYIDLSSVDRNSNKIIETEIIYKNNAPIRAQQIVYKDDILFGTTRPLLQRYCLISEQYDQQICSTGFCVLRPNKIKVLPKWILYCLSTNSFLSHIAKYEKGTSYPTISDHDVKMYKIPIPSIPVQKYIVAILDTFDSLVNDIFKGLPKEIELRQKQYEYYREKLLDFSKEIGNESHQ
ncbi:MAG TPA: restriction endonuclease subunit S [Planctomycetota bacterium]|nr:restriction endonuclease subunit S [Planctomycetota bacterium]HRU52110.1 restriction endonuclease subunit S [Planctomycetota bacterium]